MIRLLSLLIILSFLGFGSCKKKLTDPDYCSAGWATQVQDEATALSNAMTVYVNDPTAANCLAYKDAYQDYIDALKPFSECTLWPLQQKESFEAALAEAEAEISTLCN